MVIILTLLWIDTGGLVFVKLFDTYYFVVVSFSFFMSFVVSFYLLSILMLVAWFSP